MNNSKYSLDTDSIYPILLYSQTIIIYPFLILFGIIFNSLAGLTLLQKNLRKNLTYFALALVSLCDIGVLIIGLGNQWCRYTLHYEFRTISNFFCKFHVALTHIFIDFSIWILCVITIHRILLVWLPNKFQSFISKFTMIIGLLFVGSIIIIKNIILGTQFELKIITTLPGLPNKLCGIFPESFNDKRDIYFAWVELFTKFLIPFPLQLILNIFLVCKVKSYARKLNRLRSLSSSSSSKINGFFNTSVIVFAINICFLFCYGPYGLFSLFVAAKSIIEKLENQDAESSQVVRNLFFLIQQSTFTLQYLNHVINFILYFLLGKYFRKNVLSLLNFPKKGRRNCHSSTNALVNNLTRNHNFIPNACIYHSVEVILMSSQKSNLTIHHARKFSDFSYLRSIPLNKIPFLATLRGKPKDIKAELPQAKQSDKTYISNSYSFSQLNEKNKLSNNKSYNQMIEHFKYIDCD